MNINNLTETEQQDFYRLLKKMNGEEPDKKQDVKVKKPRQSEEYFCISNDGAVKQSRWTNDSFDKGRWELGNVFFTEESAWLAREKKKVEVATLSKMLEVSQVTIRKDLDALEELNFLTREHSL